MSDTTLPKFQQIQHEFIQAIREPDKYQGPQDVDKSRLKVYQELLFNGISETLSNAFPVLHSILSAKRWQDLVKEFFAQHSSTSPYFYKIPKEFLHFLQYEYNDNTNPAFLLELAHYEWVELALELAEDEVVYHDNILNKNNMLEAPLELSPLAWLLSYQYPVHKISPDYQPKRPEPCHIVVYRNREFKVKFMEVNAVTARLIDMIRTAKKLIPEAVLQQIAKELKHPKPNVVIESGKTILKDLIRKDILIFTHVTKI